MLKEVKNDIIAKVKDNTKNPKTALSRICVSKAILDGMTYMQIRRALQDDTLGIGRKITKNGAEKLLADVYKDMKQCFQEEKEYLINAQYERLMNLYATSMAVNDRQNALGALKELNKMTGLYANKVDVNLSGEIEIDFGLDTDDEG